MSTSRGGCPVSICFEWPYCSVQNIQAQQAVQDAQLAERQARAAELRARHAELAAQHAELTEQMAARGVAVPAAGRAGDYQAMLLSLPQNVQTQVQRESSVENETVL